MRIWELAESRRQSPSSADPADRLRSTGELELARLWTPIFIVSVDLTSCEVSGGFDAAGCMCGRDPRETTSFTGETSKSRWGAWWGGFARVWLFWKDGRSLEKVWRSEFWLLVLPSRCFSRLEAAGSFGCACGSIHFSINRACSCRFDGEGLGSSIGARWAGEEGLGGGSATFLASITIGVMVAGATRGVCLRDASGSWLFSLSSLMLFSPRFLSSWHFLMIWLLSGFLEASLSTSLANFW